MLTLNEKPNGQYRYWNHLSVTTGYGKDAISAYLEAFEIMENELKNYFPEAEGVFHFQKQLTSYPHYNGDWYESRFCILLSGHPFKYIK